MEHHAKVNFSEYKIPRLPKADSTPAEYNSPLRAWSSRYSPYDAKVGNRGEHFVARNQSIRKDRSAKHQQVKHPPIDDKVSRTLARCVAIIKTKQAAKKSNGSSPTPTSSSSFSSNSDKSTKNKQRH